MRSARFLGWRRSEIARGFSAFAAIDTTNLVVDTSIRFLLGGLIGASGLGSFSLILAISAVIQQFFDLRIGNFTTRYVTESITKGDNATTGALIKAAYIIDLVIGAAAFLAIMVSASWLTNTIYDQPQLTASLQVYALAVLAATIQDTSAGVLRATEKYAWMSTSHIGARILELGLVGALAWVTRDLTAVLIALVAKEVVASFVGVILMKRAIAERGISVAKSNLSILRPRRRELARFLFNTNLDSYAGVIAAKLDVLVLGRYVSLAELGIFRLAVSVATPVVLLVHPLRRTLLQVFVRARDAGRVAIVRLVKRTSVFAVTATAVLSVVIVLAGNSVLSLILSENVDRSLLALLAGRYVVEAFVIWAVPLLLALDAVKVVGRRALLYIFLYPALLIPAVQLWGAFGAAGALLAVTTVAHGYTGITAVQRLQRL